MLLSCNLRTAGGSHYAVMRSLAIFVAMALWCANGESDSTTAPSTQRSVLAPSTTQQAFGDTLVLYVAPSHRASSNTLQCGSELMPCDLQAALDAAPPYTVLLLLPGEYRGSYYVTNILRLVAITPSSKSSTIVANDGTSVVFDGEFRHRPLTFDGVPAWVEGITFRNGVGFEAGCVLVRRISNHHGQGNNFTRCTFTNCTGEARNDVLPQSTRSQAVAGAVAVQYQHSSGSMFDVTRTHMENNYARGGANAAGGLAVRYGPPSTGITSTAVASLSSTTTAASATQRAAATQGAPVRYCSTMILSTQQENLQHMDGAYRRVKGVLHGGKPVWSSVASANVGVRNGPLTPHMIAFCGQHRTWHLVPILAGVPTSKALHQHPPCTSSVLTSFSRGDDDEAHAPTGVTKWVLSNGNGAVEALRFTCQDSASYCPTIQLVNAAGSQAHRNGLYTQLNFLRAGRPTFKKVFDGERTQYIWYCAGMKEWIVSDDDPSEATDTQLICSRGIATAETLAMHPVLASGWRFWDLDMWRSSPAGRHGIRVSCTLPEQDLCQTVELVNGPMQDFYSGPYLLTGFMWNQRPTYTLRPPHESYIWFCGTFNEWVVSEADPKTLVPGDERCSRALSSHPTQAPTPYQLTTHWAQFLDDEWVQTTGQVRIRCVDDCPRIVVDALGYQPRYKVYLGVYEAIGRLTPSETASQPKHSLSELSDPTPSALGVRNTEGHRVYRKLNQHEPSFLYYVPSRDCWVVSRSLDADDLDAVFVEACDGAPYASVFHAANWSVGETHRNRSNASTTSDATATGPSDASDIVDPQPTLSCDVQPHCRRINVTAVLYVRQEYLIGVYEPLDRLHNHRPIYLHNFTLRAHPSEPPMHYMYYCAAFTKWVVGPEPPTDGRCPAWIASKSTSATHPLSNVHWVLNGDGVKWETSTIGVRMGCADDELYHAQQQEMEANAQSRGSPLRGTGPLDDDAQQAARSQSGVGSTYHDPSTNANRAAVRKQTKGNKRATSDPFFVGSQVWDTFSECSFTGNVAHGGSKSLEGDTATLTSSSVSFEQHTAGLIAGGAIALDYGNSAIGDDPIGTVRRTTILRNEASGADSGGGMVVQSAYPYRTASVTWTDVTLAENRGSAGGAALSSVKLSSNRVHVVRNYGYGRGGGVRLSEGSNITGSSWNCRHNFALVDGGCGALDASSYLSLSRSEIVNNSALRNSGTSFSGGSIVVSESKVLSVHQYGIRAFFLMLSSSELSCAFGTPMSLTDGFGCTPSLDHEGGSWRSTPSGDSTVAQTSTLHVGAAEGGNEEGGATSRDNWMYLVDLGLLAVTSFVIAKGWRHFAGFASNWSRKKVDARKPSNRK